MAETGHAKNLENLKKLRDFAASWGVSYTPSNPLLLITALNALVTAAEAALDGVQSARTPYRNASAAADDAFEPLSKLMSRVRQNLKASGVSPSILEDADTYFRKIKGKRKTKAVADDPATPADESDASHSASQMSRFQRIQSLEALNLLLASNAPYAPNEADLRVSSLNNYATDLQNKTDAVQAAFIPYSNEMADRDAIYYGDASSVVTVASLFKSYVQAAFGRDSSQWAQVKDLEFRKYRRR
jgi:hypothetical protein